MIGAFFSLVVCAARGGMVTSLAVRGGNGMSQRNKVLILCLVMIGVGLVWILNLLIRQQPTESIRWEQEVTVSDHTVLCE